MRLLLAPHSDDECLFAAYTIMRYRPTVIICTEYDGSRGPSANQRMVESLDAMSMLRAGVYFLGVKESIINEGNYCLASLTNFKKKYKLDSLQCIYAPAPQGGHWHHDYIGNLAGELGKLWNVPVIYYATYTKDNLKPFGDIEIVPTEAEFELKKKALACYKSQWKLNPQHFEAVLEARSEFYISH